MVKLFPALSTNSSVSEKVYLASPSNTISKLLPPQSGLGAEVTSPLTSLAETEIIFSRATKLSSSTKIFAVLD